MRGRDTTDIDLSADTNNRTHSRTACFFLGDGAIPLSDVVKAVITNPGTDGGASPNY
jgi:hypothetical protein